MFTFISDSGHGWARIPLTLLDLLEIRDQISEYSFQHGKFSFLEEDCDLMIFIDAYKQRFNEAPIFTDKPVNGYSAIRDYTPFS